MLIQLSLYALVAVVAAPSSRAAQLDCTAMTQRPALNRDHLTTFKHGNFSLQFAGFFNWTSPEDKSQQGKFLPLSLREFSVGPSKRNAEKYTLTLEFDCGTLEIDEYSKPGDDRAEALYSIYGFWPAIKVEGLDFCDINSPPSNYKFSPVPYGGVEMRNELHNCFVEISGKPSGRYTRIGAVVVQHMALNNSAIWTPPEPTAKPTDEDLLPEDDFLRIMQ